MNTQLFYSRDANIIGNYANYVTYVDISWKFCLFNYKSRISERISSVSIVFINNKKDIERLYLGQ